MAVCDNAEKIGCICSACARRNESDACLCCVGQPELLCKAYGDKIGIAPGLVAYTCKRYRKESEK